MGSSDQGSATQEILQSVALTNWAAVGIADPAEVEYAFALLTRAITETDAADAYDAIVTVLADNHSGRVGPAAAPAAPILARVVTQGDGLARQAALGVLVDLFTWARAGAADTPTVTTALHGAALGLKPQLERLARGRTTKTTPSLASALLQALDP